MQLNRLRCSYVHVRTGTPCVARCMALEASCNWKPLTSFKPWTLGWATADIPKSRMMPSRVYCVTNIRRTTGKSRPLVSVADSGQICMQFYYDSFLGHTMDNIASILSMHGHTELRLYCYHSNNLKRAWNDDSNGIHTNERSEYTKPAVYMLSVRAFNQFTYTTRACVSYTPWLARSGSSNGE